MGWVNKPMVFKKPQMWDLGTRYPVSVTEYNEDGTVTGIIDEDRLTSVKRILLDTEMN